MTINDIIDTVAAQWQAFLRYQKSVLQSDVTLLNLINDYQDEHSGKHLRPLLVLLSASATHSRDTHTAQLATAVELLHNASLMHDDVVDNDDFRRGAASIQHRWNIRVALLTGDYYLARMIQVLNEVGDPAISKIVVATATAMAEGELLQQQLLLDGGKCDTDIYLRIIERKTARLMQTCCELGTNRNDDTALNLLRQFGHNYGMAFQLHDDIDDSNDEQLPWMPDSDTLRQLLQQHCSQAREALLALPSTVQRDALMQLIKNLEI